MKEMKIEINTSSVLSMLDEMAREDCSSKIYYIKHYSPNALAIEMCERNKLPYDKFGSKIIKEIEYVINLLHIKTLFVNKTERS